MTPDQEKDQQRLSRHIVSSGLISYMNDTKWSHLLRELVAMTESDFNATIKYVREDGIHGPSPISWTEVQAIGNYKSIEWIRLFKQKEQHIGRLVDPRIIDYESPLLDALSKSGVYFEDEGLCFMVYGYKRPASQQGVSEGTPLRGAPEL